MSRNAIGILALQGDFAAHRKAFARCGVEALEVRHPSVLEELRGLVLPGGESTTLLRLMREGGFDEALPRFVENGGSLFGTCAGAILLAREVSSPSQWSLGLIDMAIERNAYGRQIDSFETELTDVDPEILGMHPADPDPPRTTADPPLGAVFIRAPRILRVGPSATVMASLAGEPVLVREGRVLVSTFHPEMTADSRVHRYFLERVLVNP